MAPWLLRFMEAGLPSYPRLKCWSFSSVRTCKNTIKSPSQTSPSELNKNQLRWLWKPVLLNKKLRILHCNRNVLKDSMVSSASFEVRRFKRWRWMSDFSVWAYRSYVSPPIFCRVLSWVALGWGFVFCQGVRFRQFEIQSFKVVWFQCIGLWCCRHLLKSALLLAWQSL